MNSLKKHLLYIIIFFTYLNSPLSILVYPSYADIDAWPLLEITEDSTTVCYPFYVKEKNFKMVFPIYFNTNKGKDHHFFWPILKITEQRIKRAVPFWFSENDNFTLFPFIRQTPEYTMWSIPPIYFSKDNGFSAIIPFYIKNKKQIFIFPNIYFHKSENKMKSFKFFPIVDYVNDDNTKSINYFYVLGKKKKTNFFSKWFFPFYYSSIQKGKNKLWLLPYFYKNNSYQTVNAVLPFYWDAKGKWHHKFNFFNYYNYKDVNWVKSGFFPIYHLMESKLSRNRSKSVISLFCSLYRKEIILSQEGKLLERKRRFLFFSDILKSDGKRLFKIFDSIISERM